MCGDPAGFIVFDVNFARGTMWTSIQAKTASMTTAGRVHSVTDKKRTASDSAMVYTYT